MSTSPRIYPAELPGECPNGACPASMYNMEMINAPKLWARLAAVPNADPALATARFAMVIDSGVWFGHDDFAPSGTTTIDRDLSRTFNSEGALMTDGGIGGNDEAQGHGTHVAGILAAGWGGGDARAIAGVAGRARLASCRIFADYQGLGTVSANTFDELSCIDLAAGSRAFVVNYSGGTYYVAGSTALEAMRAAVTRFCASGGVFVAAAGNDGRDFARDPFYPAAFAGQPGLECVVAVAAVARGGYMPYFSNYGAAVRIAAPGDHTRSDWVQAEGSLRDGGSLGGLELAGTTRAYVSIPGTSMAAPHVAGAALLLGNAFPRATGGQVRGCLEASGVPRPLGDGAGAGGGGEDEFPPNEEGFISGGLLDVDAAYDCVAERLAGGTTCLPNYVVDVGRGDLGLACGDALPAVPPAAYAGGKPGVSYAFDPPGPYPADNVGRTIRVRPLDGSARCALFGFRVKPCALRCAADPVDVYHNATAPAPCAPAGAPFPAGAAAAAAAAVVVAPPGITYTVHPPGPYPPNRPGTLTRVTITPSNSPASPSCAAELNVVPCGVRCPVGVVRVDQDANGGSCAAAGAGGGTPFPAAQARLALDAPSVAYTITSTPPPSGGSPAAPLFARGAYSVTVAPNTLALPCYVSLIVEPCKLGCAPTAAASLNAPGGGGGGCLASVPFPASAVAAGPGLTYALSPPGPFASAGTFAVVATPGNGGAPCSTLLTVTACTAPPAPSPSPSPVPSPSPSPPPPPPPTICAASTQTVDLAVASGTNSCASGATALPAGAVTVPAGATVAYAPPAPWKAGTWSVVATPSNGGKPCSVALAVKACPPPPPPAGKLTCVPAAVQLRRTVIEGSCDGADVAPQLLYATSAGVTATVSPAAPYPPGTTAVRVTPAPGSAAGAVACDAAVVVAPCPAECQPGLAAAADPGKCSASSLPDGFVLPASKGRTAASVAATPSAPFPVGRTAVSAAVSYGPGVGSSARSAECALTVTDAEKPTVSGLSACLYPAGAAAYAPTQVCFGPSELLAAAPSDNCGAAALTLAALSCANVSPAANGASACRANGTAGVCVALRRLPQRRTTPRVVRATVRATDAAGNSADAVATLRVFRRQPTNATRADPACLRVSATGRLQAALPRPAVASVARRLPRVRLAAAAAAAAAPEASDDA